MSKDTGIFLLGLFFGTIIGYSWAKPHVPVRKVREFKRAFR